MGGQSLAQGLDRVEGRAGDRADHRAARRSRGHPEPQRERRAELEALRKRYGAPSLLVAQAQPADGGLHVYIEGETKLGKVSINKIYDTEEGNPAPPEALAAAAFQKLLVKADQDQEQKLASERATQQANTSQTLSVSVPFTSPREWNAIRSRILTTPNVIGVDLSSLSADGAVIKLSFSRTVEELQGNMQAAGLSLANTGSAWVIQPM